MGYSLGAIAKNSKGSTVYRSARNCYQDTYSLQIPHSETRIICDIPKENRNDIIKVLRKIASHIARLDETATPFHKASMHIDENMKEG